MMSTQRLESDTPTVPQRAWRLDAGHPLVSAVAAFACALLIMGGIRTASASGIDPRLTELSRQMSLADEAGAASAQFPDGMVSMFVEGDVDEAQLAAMGGSAGSAAGSIRTIRIPATQLSRFLSSRGIVGAQLGRPTEYQMVASVPSTGASQLWGGTPGHYTGVTGKGVIVGIVDSGIDLRHHDFKNTDNSTRILYLWDQTKTATPPAPFTYGTEWSAAQINAGQCTETDGIGHGTFMASVAAGNGSATGAGLPAYQYIGMAPEASIIVVNAFANDTYLVDGVEYVFRKAQSLGMPAVVLIASGVRQGPHDGTDPAELRLSSLCTTYGPSRLVVSAAGNYGNQPIHAGASVTKGSTSTMTVRIPSGTALTGPVVCKLDGWYGAGHAYSVTVVTPGNVTAGTAAAGTTLDVTVAEAHVTILNGMTKNSKNDSNVYLSLTPGSSGALAAGAYTIKVTTTDAASGMVDFWLGDYQLNSLVPAFEQGVNYNDTVMTPATADSVICVGAFTWRNTWTAAGGQQYGLSGLPTLGDIAAWSGRGVRRDGRLYPDLAAPGQAIGGARSGWTAVSGVFILPDSVHMISTGTSIAAAHVAGALALELQDRKQKGQSLSVSGARQLLRANAVKDSYFYAVSSADSNLVWGAGKLHLPTSGQVGVGDLPSLGLRFAPLSPNPSTGGSNRFTFELSAAEVGDPNGVHLDIVDVAGRRVREIRGAAVVGGQTLVWDGHDDRGASVPAGIYFATLHAGGAQASQKFIRLGN